MMALSWYCLAALPGDALTLCHLKVRPFNPSGAEWDSLFTIHYGWRRGSAQLLLCLGEEVKHSKLHTSVVRCYDLLIAFPTSLYEGWICIQRPRRRQFSCSSHYRFDLMHQKFNRM